MSGELVEIEPGEVTVLRLNNPPLNLISVEVTRALDAALSRLESDPDIRAVVVTGAGDRAFCVARREGVQGAQGRAGEETAVKAVSAARPAPDATSPPSAGMPWGRPRARCAVTSWWPTRTPVSDCPRCASE